ncbi:hypothetical protein SNEBB_008364 [Seison nebaliae]|nr:hypothetical protein SNEBB_008364 [Seison nebaliae]
MDVVLNTNSKNSNFFYDSEIALSKDNRRKCHVYNLLPSNNRINNNMMRSSTNNTGEHHQNSKQNHHHQHHPDSSYKKQQSNDKYSENPYSHQQGSTRSRYKASSKRYPMKDDVEANVKLLYYSSKTISQNCTNKNIDHEKKTRAATKGHKSKAEQFRNTSITHFPPLSSKNLSANKNLLTSLDNTDPNNSSTTSFQRTLNKRHYSQPNRHKRNRGTHRISPEDKYAQLQRFGMRTTTKVQIPTNNWNSHDVIQVNLNDSRDDTDHQYDDDTILHYRKLNDISKTKTIMTSFSSMNIDRNDEIIAYDYEDTTPPTDLSNDSIRLDSKQDSISINKSKKEQSTNKHLKEKEIKEKSIDLNENKRFVYSSHLA